MNVLCIAPVMTKALCDTYSTYVKIHGKGVNLVFITGRSSGARGRYELPAYENIDGVSVYRLYRDSREMFIFPRRRLKDVLKIARRLEPDLILCCLADNMRLAMLLRRYMRIPIVLQVESASWVLSKKFVDGWKTRVIRRFLRMPTTGERLWSWLCEKAEAVITSRPRDQQVLGLLSRHGTPVYYLAWPAEVPEGLRFPSIRDRYRGIYAGLLVPLKNTQEFEWVLPLILQGTPTKRFTIIGLGSHVDIIVKLRQKFGDAIEYIPRLPRSEVLRLIASSYYAYTPVKVSYSGFMGDCWGTGTPILLSHNALASKDVDVLVARNPTELVSKINRLYEDAEFYKKLQEIGYDQYNKRTADVISEELYDIFLRTLERASAKEC